MASYGARRHRQEYVDEWGHFMNIQSKVYEAIELKQEREHRENLKKTYA